jgi:ribosomal protein L40E
VSILNSRTKLLGEIVGVVLMTEPASPFRAAREESHIKLCLECGADNPASAKSCWMCYSDLADAPLIVEAEVAEMVEVKSPRPTLAPSD